MALALPRPAAALAPLVAEAPLAQAAACWRRDRGGPGQGGDARGKILPRHTRSSGIRRDVARPKGELTYENDCKARVTQAVVGSFS